MKKIILSLALIAAVATAGYLATTSAFFSDTETSNGNVFTAGSLDLQVDHTLATYNGEECVSQCEETGDNLIINGGFEEPIVTDHNGRWQVYPDASLTHWTVESGDGLEIQRNSVAGDPHSGHQLAELDSNNSSIISQSFSTTPGQAYRLVFYYSPRPNVPAGGNTLGLEVQVVDNQNGGPIFTDSIMQNTAGGTNTDWQPYTYNFKAVSSITTIRFSDEGVNDSFGGYLDDISVKALNCQTSYPDGGTCMLWNTRNLGPDDTFWSFDDVKPGDYGTDVISLHLDDNPGWVCLNFANQQDLENQCNEPETEAGDTTCGTDEGELSQYLQIFTWADNNHNGIYEPNAPENEQAFMGQPTSLADYQSSGYDSNFGPAVNPADGTRYMGLAWCAGTLEVQSNGDFTCDPAGMNNLTQTDSLTTDVVLYTEQARHNADFVCSQNGGNGGSLVNCDDGDACTNDYYDGTCQHTPISCDDGVAKTSDSCDPSDGCHHDLISCTTGSDCPPLTGCNMTQGYCE